MRSAAHGGIRIPMHADDARSQTVRAQRLRTAVASPLAVLISACAFTDVPLTLPEAPLEVQVAGGKGRQVVVVTPFRDDRGEVKVRCGRMINNYGMDTADAVCQSDPTAWISRRFVEGLRGAGFTVIEEGQEHGPGALRVEGSL